MNMEIRVGVVAVISTEVQECVCCIYYIIAKETVADVDCRVVHRVDFALHRIPEHIRYAGKLIRTETADVQVPKPTAIVEQAGHGRNIRSAAIITEIQ